MSPFDSISNEIILFFQLNGLIDSLNSNNLDLLFTQKNLQFLLGPIIPFLLAFEFIVGVIKKAPQMKVYKINFLIYLFNRLLAKFIHIPIVGFLIFSLNDHGLIETKFTWYWIIYSYIIWELGHYIYHFLCHKVRFFWCFHSTHHAPEQMNLSVSHAHFFFEGAIAGIIRTTTCMLLGVSPEMFFLIIIIDSFYGSFIHISENLLPNGRLGFLNKIILTPSHHRVHHGKNPLYIDTNYCNFLNIWDKIFGTFQNENPSIKVEYGITRKVDSGSFFDVYFGEIKDLFIAVVTVKGAMNKIMYLIMPPGWSHTGSHTTAKAIREHYLRTISPQA